MQKNKKDIRDKYLGGFIICVFLLIALVLLVGISLKQARAATANPLEESTTSDPNQEFKDNPGNFVNSLLEKPKEINSVWEKLSSDNQKKVWESISSTDSTKKQDLLKSLDDNNKGSLFKSFGTDGQSTKLKEDFLEELYKSGGADGTKKVGDFFNDVLNKKDLNLGKDKNLAGDFLLKKGFANLKKEGGTTAKFTQEQIDAKKLGLKGLEDNSMKYFNKGVIGTSETDGINVGKPAPWLRSGEYKDGKFTETFDTQLTNEEGKYRTFVHDKGIVDNEGKFNGVDIMYGEGGGITASVDKNGVTTTFDFTKTGEEQPAIRFGDDVLAGRNGGRAVLDKVAYNDGKNVIEKTVLKDISDSQVWANAQYPENGKEGKWLYFEFPKADTSGSGMAIYHSDDAFKIPKVLGPSFVSIDDKNNVAIVGNDILFRPVRINVNQLAAVGNNIEVLSIEGTFARINKVDAETLRQRLQQDTTSSQGFTRYSNNPDAYGLNINRDTLRVLQELQGVQIPSQVPPVKGITPSGSVSTSGTNGVFPVGTNPNLGTSVPIKTPEGSVPLPKGVQIKGWNPKANPGTCPPGGCLGGCTTGTCPTAPKSGK